MDNLSKQIMAEKENVEMVLSNLKEAMARKKRSVIELAAMGTFAKHSYESP